MALAEKRSGLLWPSILTVMGLAVLLGLGTWQMRRLAWKEDLLARLAASEKAPPVAFTEMMSEIEKSSLGENVFRRVRLSGSFDHAHEFHVWSPGKSGPAWSVVTPLKLSEPYGQGRRFPIDEVLVIRGVVTEARKAVDVRRDGNPNTPVTFIARVREGGHGAFASTPDGVHNQWYSLDLAAMRRAVATWRSEGVGSTSPDDQIASIAPLFLEAVAPTGGAAGPQPQLDGLNLSNRHLEYALTWYGLAVTLIGVFLAFVVSRRRSSGG